MALDALPLTAPMPAPPVRQFSFTDWQVNNPTAPPPGDRLDAEFDRANGSITDTIAWASVSLNTDGTIRDGVIDENNLVSGLFDDLSQGVIDDVQPLVDQASSYASAAQVSASNSASSAATASGQAAAASGAATTANAAATTATGARDLAQGYASTASTAATDAANAENDATGAAAKASDYATLTQAWAEHMPDTIPPNILAAADVTGDHWSARWWANQAAGAFGALAALYMGALPTAPGSTPTGQPLPTGAIYYNTTDQQPYVWTGTQWVPFTKPAKAVILGLVYQATGGQTVFNTNTADLSGSTYNATTEPLEVYVNGVRVPQTDGAFTGDWDRVNNLVTFGTPLAAGTLVMIDVLTPDTSSGTLPGGPYLALAGGTMTGPLLLAANATGALQAVTKQQLDIKLNLSGGTLTGALTLSGAPVGSLDAATKAYADLRVPLAGGTMTGLLTLSGAPTAANHAATKTYVDTNVATKLNLSGGTLTGDLTLRGPPSTALMAATKGYVDAGVGGALPLAGGTMTGDLILRGSPSSANMAATKGYVDGFLPLAGGTIGGNGITYSVASTNAHATAFGWTGSRLVSYVDGLNVGNVAIGDYLPLAGGTVNGQVHADAFVVNSSNAFISSDATNTYYVQDAANWQWRYTRASGRMAYLRGGDGAELFAIDPSGNGKFSGNILQLNDGYLGMSVATADGSRHINIANTWSFDWNAANGNLSWSGGGATRFVWRASDSLSYNPAAPVGGVGAYQNLSDARTKENVQDLDYGMPQLRLLRPRRFTRIGSGTTEIGFIAQEVQPAVPEATPIMGVPLPDGSGGLDDPSPTLSVTSDALLAVAIAAIQNLDQRLATLEARP